MEMLTPELSEVIQPRMAPELSAALVSYLASRACAVNGEAFTSSLGHYARVFVGVGDGWLAREPGGVTAESVAEHLDEIRDLGAYLVPAENNAEVRRTLAQLGVES